MAKRGLKKGSKCVRKHRSGRCAKFSIPGGKARKPSTNGRRKPKATAENAWDAWAAVAAAAKKQEEAKQEGPPRVRGKFAWSEGKWAPLSGRHKRR